MPTEIKQDGNVVTAVYGLDEPKLYALVKELAALAQEHIDAQTELMELYERAQSLTARVAEIERETIETHQELKRARGIATPADYDDAFARIQAGEKHGRIRREFCARFPAVTKGAFNQAVYRRRMAANK